MSKSHPSPSSRILLTDTPTTITQKIKGAVTDSTNSISYDPITRPGVSNLLDILAAFDPDGYTPQEIIDMEGMTSPGWNLGRLKNRVADTVVEGLRGVREEFERIVCHEMFLDEVERKGAERARENAERTIRAVREVVGVGGRREEVRKEVLVRWVDYEIDNKY